MICTIGHRGAAALEPENTLRGFRKAIELKEAGLEEATVAAIEKNRRAHCWKSCQHRGGCKSSKG